MSKLQDVLNDKESMQQIKELADMLAGGTNTENSSSLSENTAFSSENENNTNTTNSTNSKPENNQPDFSALFSMLGGNPDTGSQNSNPPKNQDKNTQNAPDFDLGSIMKLQSVIQAANKPDKNVAFLMALRPLLKEENQGKIDRLVKIFRLMSIYPAVKESGLLGGDLFGLLR